MTVLIDDALATSFLTTPIREAWFDNAASIQIVSGLRAEDVSESDVALIQTPEATLLTRGHVIDRSVAIVQDGHGLIAMRTTVRPNEIDETTVYVNGVGASGEVLSRALLGPYFGITATNVVRQEPPTDALVVIAEGADALGQPEHGFTEDLARTWFILKGTAFVSHIAVVGVQALAEDADDQLGLLRSALDVGYERRRDVRRIIHEVTGVDREALSAVTGNMRFSLEPDDQEPLRSLIEQGTWGTRFGRSLPAFRDQLGKTYRVDEEEPPDG